MDKRRIAIITGSRTEYGLLYWIIKAVWDDPDLVLQLVVTGMHLSPKFGLTVREIEADGFSITERIEMLIDSDTEEAIAASMGRGMLGFASAYERLKPNIIVVLGDRFELHAAVSAALPFRIPVAHIHGGESSEGAMDEQLRHAITKMSHLHFASTEHYRRRIIQMGERPEYVFNVGAPGIDNIIKLDLFGREALCTDLGIPNDGKRIGVVTYHPVTLEANTAEGQIEELLDALQDIKEMNWIFTMTNADTGGRVIIQRIERFVESHPQTSILFSSLGRKRYISLLKHAAVMVGNSSSGIIEAPSLKLPVVNIGDRQKGRIRAANVIDVRECRKERIRDAIQKALSQDFITSLRGLKNPYGEGGASEKIVEILKSISLNEPLIKKGFHEAQHSYS